MALLGYSHIESEYKEDGCLPAGEYPMQVVKSEIIETKKGNGHYLRLQLQIIDGRHSGRIVFSQMNISNENQQAEQIGRRELGRIVSAVGLDIIEDSEELHGKPFLGKIGIEERDGFPDKNILKSAKPYGTVSLKQSPKQAERKRELSSDELAEQEIGKYRAAEIAKQQSAVSAVKNGTAHASTRATRKTPF